MAILNLADQTNRRFIVRLDIDMISFAIEYYKSMGYIVLSFLTVDNI